MYITIISPKLLFSPHRMRENFFRNNLNLDNLENKQQTFDVYIGLEENFFVTKRLSRIL